jgi:hypothetical protein
MRLHVAAAIVGILVAASPAAASPTMVRLGYAGCAQCHLSPQGGGLLTDYGRGIDAAQSLRVREYTPPDDEVTRRVVQDVRLQLGGTRWFEGAPVGGPGATEARVWHRLALMASPRHRFTSTLGLDSRPMAGSTVLEHVSVNRLTWDYRVHDGLELTVGKDTLPTGVMMADYEQLLRERAESGRSVYPAQARVAYWSRKLQLTTYAFAPGGEELAVDRQRGGGVVAGAVLWHERAIIGGTARRSTDGVTGRDLYGAYARLGFGRWGVFAEHDAVRPTPGPAMRDRVRAGGQATVFVAAREWLVTSLGTQYVRVDPATGGDTRLVARVVPAVQARFSDRVTVNVSARGVLGDVPHARSVSVQLFLKSVR